MEYTKLWCGAKVPKKFFDSPSIKYPFSLNEEHEHDTQLSNHGNVDLALNFDSYARKWLEVCETTQQVKAMRKEYKVV